LDGSVDVEDDDVDDGLDEVTEDDDVADEADDVVATDDEDYAGADEVAVAVEVDEDDTTVGWATGAGLAGWG